jgi:glutamyl-tRNA reductase
VKKADGELLIEAIDLKELKGAKERDLAEAFLTAIEGIPEKDEQFIPEELAELYNKLAEEAVDTTPEKAEKKAPAKPEKKAPEKAEKKAPAKPEKKEKIPSPYGTSIDLMCIDPNLSLKNLYSKLQKKGFDIEKSKSAINTAYSVVRKISAQLLKNGWRKK